MPLLTATDPPRRRCAPIWALLVVVVALSTIGLFAWSCYQPVTLEWGEHAVGCGRCMPISEICVPAGAHQPGGGFQIMQFPTFLGGDFYWLWWY